MLLSVHFSCLILALAYLKITLIIFAPPTLFSLLNQARSSYFLAAMSYDHIIMYLIANTYGYYTV